MAAPALSEVTSTVRQGWRFGRGLRALIKDPVPAAGAAPSFERDVRDRAARFLDSLDRNVWSSAPSPFRALLEHSGHDRTSVRRLVSDRGLESILEQLRDQGVYVSYEEYLGKVPLRRGRLELHLDPTSFHNRTVMADYLGSTGGTRSGGTPVAMSFEEKRSAAPRTHLRDAAYGQHPDQPVAVWFPCLPSAAGLGAILSGVTAGRPPERWFSQIPTTMEGIPASKRITNTMLPAFGRLSGMPLPRAEHTPSSDPAPVLAWCIEALSRAGSARLSTYPSSAVRLARLAEAEGESLDGLLVTVLGEPATMGRRRAIERSGARTAAGYAFMQAGGAGTTCPHETRERYHVYEDKLAVVPRRRRRPDGVEVDAFLWTTMSGTARGVFINVENDDYGSIERDSEPCSCLFGQLGVRTRVGDVRGISKVVAAGVTVAGEVFERLVDEVLPAAFGGSPLEYQFAELDREDLGTLVLRIDPSIGTVEEAAVLSIVRDELSRQEVGRLADAVWAPADSVRVLREPPTAAPSGKTLPYEPLGVARGPLPR